MTAIKAQWVGGPHDGGWIALPEPKHELVIRTLDQPMSAIMKPDPTSAPRKVAYLEGRVRARLRPNGWRLYWNQIRWGLVNDY